MVWNSIKNYFLACNISKRFVVEGVTTRTPVFQDPRKFTVPVSSRALHWLWIIYFREEDNIDVQPILHCQHGILEQVFGKFQLGSVIDVNDTDKSVIVAEVNNKKLA